MKKILITGSNGQLGNEMRLLAAQSNQEMDFCFTDIDELDITDEDRVMAFCRNGGFAWIINCAAYTAVDRAETDQEAALKVNASAPAILAYAAKSINAAFIHISTDYVFDGQGNQPYTETDLVNPRSFYGKSKLRGEEAVALSGADAFIIRTAWLYSAFGHNFVKTMQKYGRERGELKVVFDQVGTPTWAADLAKVMHHIVEAGIRPRKTEILHYSNEGVCSWYDFAIHILQTSGIRCNVIPIRTHEYPLPAPRPTFSVLDKTRIKERLGVEVPYWGDSLKNCLTFMHGQS
jgi:dTDP-4-dehydrorhamnose reductase